MTDAKTELRRRLMHRQLLTWYTSLGHPAPKCAEDIINTMRPQEPAPPPKPKTPDRDSIINDGRVWYEHGQVAKMAGVSENRLIYHRTQSHIPITGVRCKDPDQTGVGFRWFYVAEVVETYLAWLKDADVRRKAGQAKRIESRRENASNSTTLRGKAKAGTVKNV